MTDMILKKHKGRIEVNLFYNKDSKSHYHNIIDKDPNRLAQILIDLMIDGFPVEKAVKIMQEKIKKKDWMGFNF